jgi:hypothetical protein
MPKTKSKKHSSDSDSEEEIRKPDVILTEKVDCKKVLELLRSDIISDNEVRVLLEYAKRDGELTVNYYKSDKNNALYASTGLTNILATARSYLCCDDHLDIDMINCCPTILLEEIQIAEPDLEEIKYLKHYVEHRNECLEKIKSYQLDKRSILAIINGAKIRKNLPADVNAFLQGIQRCADRLFAIKDDRLYLQKKQAEYLSTLYEKLVDFGFQPVALVQDAVIVRKGKGNKSQEFINEWNSCGEFPVKICNKEWVKTEIEIRKGFNWKDPTFFNDLNINKFYNSPQEALISNLRNMVKTIVVTADWKTAIVKKTIRKEYGYERKFDIIKTKDIGIIYNLHPKIDDEGKVKPQPSVPLIALMKTVPKLFTVSMVSSFPSSEPDTFSLFRGFIPQDIERPKSDLRQYFEPVRKHMKEVWCQDNDDYFKWMENWLAFIIQKCPAKTQTIVQITGDEGTGKSCLFEWLVSKIFGELCIVLSGCDKLTRNFNAHLLGKVLVCLEEVSGDKHDLNRIKHIATADFLDIERKGIDVDTDVNAINLICFSNLDNPLPPVTGINRRLVHFRSNPKYIKDKEYFRELIKFLKTDKTAPIAFYYYYKEYNIDEDYLFNHKPVTEEKNYNRFMALQEVDRAVYYIVSKNDDQPIELTASEVAAECKRLWEKSNITPVGVGRRLTSLGFSKKQVNGTNKYLIDKNACIKYDDELALLCKEFCKDDAIVDLDKLIEKIA